MSQSWIIKEATLLMKIKVGGVGFVGEFPALPGVKGEGETYDLAVLNLARAITLHLEEALNV